MKCYDAISSVKGAGTWLVLEALSIDSGSGRALRPDSFLVMDRRQFEKRSTLIVFVCLITA